MIAGVTCVVLPARTMTPLDDVNAFIDRLAELPLHDWLEIGRDVVMHTATAGRPETAIAIVDATLAAEGLAVTAWYARDAVETAAFVVRRSDRRWTAAERCAFAAAEAAAIRAAGALLVRERIPADDFAAVVAPFVSVILPPSQQVL